MRNPIALVFDDPSEAVARRVRGVTPFVASAPHGSLALTFAPEASGSALQALELLRGRVVDLDGVRVRIVDVSTRGIEAHDVNASGELTSCVYSLSWTEVRTVHVPRDETPKGERDA